MRFALYILGSLILLPIAGVLMCVPILNIYLYTQFFRRYM